MKKTRKELIDFLKKELDYDASGGLDCPKCGHVLQKPRYWLDHKSSLSSNVTQFLGFKMGNWDDDGINGLIFRKIDDFITINGDSEEDSELLADSILSIF